MYSSSIKKITTDAEFKNIHIKASRQAGKSTMLTDMAVKHAVKNPDTNILIATSTNHEAESLMQTTISNSKHYVIKTISSPYKKIYYTNGSTILFTVPSTTNTKGMMMDYVMVDNVDFLKLEQINALKPCAKKGWIVTEND